MFAQQLSTQPHTIVDPLQRPASSQHRIGHIEMSMAHTPNRRAMGHRMQLQTDFLHQLTQIRFVLVDRVHFEREVGSLKVNALDAIHHRQLIVHRPNKSASGQFVGGLRMRIDAAQFEHFLLVRSLNRGDKGGDFVRENVRKCGPSDDAGIGEIIFGRDAQATGHMKDAQQFAFADFVSGFGAIVNTNHCGEE